MQSTSPHALSSATPTPVAQTTTITPFNGPDASQPQLHVAAPHAPMVNAQLPPPVTAPVATIPTFAAPAHGAAYMAAQALHVQPVANGMTRLMQAAHQGNAHTAQLLLQASYVVRNEQP